METDVHRGEYSENPGFFLGQSVSVQIDRPMGSCHPLYGFTYPVNYGYIPDTMAPDGAEIDAYVLGIKEAVDSYRGDCIAIIHRLNDIECKLVVVPPGTKWGDNEIRKATRFQEWCFEIEIELK